MLTDRSRANDYARNANGFSQTKAVLLNKVVVGRGCKLKANDDTLTEPPKGYDSVGPWVFLILTCL